MTSVKIIYHVILYYISYIFGVVEVIVKIILCDMILGGHVV